MDWQAATFEFDRLESLSPEEREQTLSELTSEHPELATFLRTLFERAPSSNASEPGSPASAAPGQRIGPWLVEEELGAGGMGEVYRVRRDDGLYDQLAALKLIRTPGERATARFTAERQRLARLEFPGIARIIDGGQDDAGRPYMAMEFVDGAPIDRWCEMRGSSRNERIALLRQLFHALAHAHSRLVLHRDIKPGNVLVTSDGQVRLIDFGIAALLDGDEVEGFSALTLVTAAPEQLDGTVVSTATDIFQTGMLAHKLVTGAYPARRPDGSVEIDHTKLADDDLAAILAKATATDPQARYDTIDALGDDLGHLQDGMPVLAREGGAAYRARKFITRNAVASGTAAVLVVGLVSATIVSVISANRAEAARAEAEYQLEIAEFNSMEREADSDTANAMNELFNQLAANVAGLDEAEVRAFMIEQADALMPELERSPEHVAGALTGIAYFLQTKGDYAASENVARRLVEAEGVSEIARINALNMQGRNLRELGRNDESSAALLEVLEWMRQRPFLVESDGYADILKNYVLYSGDQSALPEALQRIAAIAAKEDEDVNYRSYMYNEASVLAQKAGDFDQAITYQKQSWELANSDPAVNSFSLAVRSLNLVSLILWGQNDPQEAARYFPEEASVFGEGRGNIRGSTYYRWLQSVSRSMAGEDEQALALALEAHELAKSDLPPDDRFYTGTAAHVVEVGALNGDFDLAEQHLAAARQDETNPEGFAQYLMAEALLRHQQGRTREARALFAQTAELADVIGGRAELAFKRDRLRSLLGPA